MDKQTAIDLLDNLIGMVEDNHDSDYDTAIKMGIDALKEKMQLSDEDATKDATFDYIDRQAAIEAAIEAADIWDGGYNYERGLCITEGLQRVPSVQPQRWIPVSEALPDRGKTVLITNDKGNVRCGRFRGVEFWKDDGDAYWTFKGNTVEHVLAWMPLPEPYAERKEDE